MNKKDLTKVHADAYRPFLKSWAVLCANLSELSELQLETLISLELERAEPREMFLRRLNSRLFTKRKKENWSKIEACLKKR